MSKIKKMTPGEITCASCGAHYGAEQLRCPYCGSVNDLADEREFMEDLGEIREDLEKLPSEAESHGTRQAFRDMGRVFRRTLLAVLVLCAGIGAVLLFSRAYEARSDAEREEERQAEYLWKEENFPKLDALYEAGDYDGLFALSEELSDGPVWQWEHYGLIEGLRLIRNAKEDIRMAEDLLREGESAKELYGRYAAWVLQEELLLWFFDLSCRDEKDCAVVRGRAADILADMETRFALTEEELEFFRREAEEYSGYIRYQTCEEFLAGRQQ